MKLPRVTGDKVVRALKRGDLWRYEREEVIATCTTNKRTDL